MLSITIQPQDLRFKKIAHTSRGAYRTRRVYYLTATLRKGEVSYWGIGECAPLPDLNPEVAHSSLEDFEQLLRQACRHYEHTGQIAYADLQHAPSILMGLETLERSLRACEKTGNPYALYNTDFARGEVGIAINGLVWMGSHSEMQQELEAKIEQGFRCIKLKIGAIDFAQELSLLQSIRQRFSPQELEIRLDANGAFSPAEALDKLHTLAQFHIHSIEQPIRAGQWEEMGCLSQQSPIPIALDEELIGIHDSATKAALLDAIQPQYIILKPTLHGGFAGAEEWIKLAAQRHIGHWATSALESHVGLNAIAQWCSHIYDHPQQPMPTQGLGTGQLFVENYPDIVMDIEAARLWNKTPALQNMQEDIRLFLKEWQNDAPYVLAQSSGSTGQPKALQLEKSKMRHSAEATLRYFGLTSTDSFLLCLPLSYIAGKMQLLRAFLCGAPVMAVAPHRRPLRHLTQSPSFAAMTPMQVQHSLEHAHDRKILSGIRQIIIGGSGVAQELESQLQSLEAACYSTYGMTETCSHIAFRPLNGPARSNYYTALPGIHVSLNEHAQICIYAPQYNAQPLTTNDVGELLPDGRFRIVGRRDNVVCSGGIKLQIETLEARLAALPYACALTALPDPYLGEALTLVCASDAPQSEAALEMVRNFCRHQFGRYEMPQHFLAISQLPHTHSQKIDRVALKNWAAQQFAAEKKQD